MHVPEYFIIVVTHLVTMVGGAYPPYTAFRVEEFRYVCGNYGYRNCQRLGPPSPQQLTLKKIGQAHEWGVEVNFTHLSGADGVISATAPPAEIAHYDDGKMQTLIDSQVSIDDIF
eukprot:SAG31_NODE_20936_length_561_cov_2.188312_1_plen_115_part_00